MRPRFASWLAVVKLVLVVLGSGVVGYLLGQARSTPAGRPEYVALGSSGAAGPGMSTRTPESPSFCFQSDQNYAHQLARMQRLSLVDMRCGGATSKDILSDALLFQGPQLLATTKQSMLDDLVAVPVGAFADPSFPVPTVSDCRRRKPPWLEIGARIEHVW